MEVIVHGTKGGYKVLCQTENVPFSIARDVRRIDRNDGNPVGQSAYSIAFAEGGCAFTKYIIVRDKERAAVGNIAFSVFLHGTKKLPGKDIKNLLDELAEKYSHDYIIDGNLGNKQEDWAFVIALVDKYKNKCILDSPGDSESFKQGTAEAAYVYFSEEELQKYFDEPDQELYLKFRQVFFVNVNLQEKLENPLNALRHDPMQDLTGRIDLENTKYRLKDFHGKGENGITIVIWVENQKKYNKDSIYKKDTIQITYSKDKYFEQINASGKLTDSDINHYLEIVGSNKIKVKTDVQLTKIRHNFTIHVEDIGGNVIPDAEITCKSESSTAEKKIENNLISFEGEEMNSRWKVLAKKDGLIAELSSFVPENNIGKPIILKFKKQYKDTFEINQHKEQLGTKSDWGIHGNKKNNVSESTIQQKSKNKTILSKENLIAMGLTGLFVIGVIVVLVCFPISGSSNKTTLNGDLKEILDYADGSVLNKEKLDSIKSKYCPSNSGSSEEARNTGLGSFLRKFSPFNKKEENKKSNTTNSLDYCKKIENAINIRVAITNVNLDELKKLHYSDLQYSLKQSIDSLINVDSVFKQDIVKHLKSANPSKMDLKEVAEFINMELGNLKNEMKTWNDKIKETNPDIKKSNNGNANRPTHNNNSGNNPKDAHGLSEVDKSNFWELIKQPNVEKQSFDNLFKGKTNIYEEPIKIYYNNYLLSNEKFNTFSGIPIIVRERAAAKKDLQILKDYKK